MLVAASSSSYVKSKKDIKASLAGDNTVNVDFVYRIKCAHICLYIDD